MTMCFKKHVFFCFVFTTCLIEGVCCLCCYVDTCLTVLYLKMRLKMYANLKRKIFRHAESLDYFKRCSTTCFFFFFFFFSVFCFNWPKSG